MNTTTATCYKVLELNPEDQGWATQVEVAISEQSQAGWELVTMFEREHQAQQVGSGTVHVPGLVSLAMIFKRTG
jgi:hypothetical protein